MSSFIVSILAPERKHATPLSNVASVCFLFNQYNNISHHHSPVNGPKGTGKTNAQENGPNLLHYFSLQRQKHPPRTHNLRLTRTYIYIYVWSSSAGTVYWALTVPSLTLSVNNWVLQRELKHDKSYGNCFLSSVVGFSRSIFRLPEFTNRITYKP